MKNLLILALLSICMVGLYSKEITGALGLSAKQSSFKKKSVRDDGKHDDKRRPMTPEEFEQLAKKDPDAYRKFLQSYEEPAERNEVDKLMNLLAHGKYE